MFIRQTLSFAAHCAAGLAIGALAVAALKAMREGAEPALAKLGSNRTATVKTPSQD